MTTAPFALRYYQTEAVDATYRWFEENPGNPLIVLPTGTGKSVVIAEFCRQTLASWPDTKIVVVTHVRELIRQNAEEMIRLWPEAPIGINSAGLGRRDTQDPIVFAGIQSVHNKATDFFRVDLVLVDEAHLIPAKSNTMYRRFIDTLKVMNPYVKIVGLTATPYRLDSGRLDEGDERLFDGIAYEAPLLDMIEKGYLSPVVSKATATKLDVSGVGRRGGDYIAADLQRAVDKDDINRAAVAEIIERGAERKSWLIFCSGVEHAMNIAAIVRQGGISCETIFGDTPKDERDRIIAAFKAGRIRCIASMAVLTTGFNAPAVDLIAMLRPTESTGLYVQIMGRGMRLAPGKDNCLVLDFASNVARHGPVDAVNPKKPGKGETAEAPSKECPECGSIVHAAVRICPDCGHEFPAPEIKITPVAAVLPVLSTETTPAEWVTVSQVMYGAHRKLGKPTSLKVEYVSGMSIHTEWICLEHDGYAQTKAISWWMRRAPQGSPVPKTVEEALRSVQSLTEPTEIKIRRSGKYIEVVDAKLVRDLPSPVGGFRVQPAAGWPSRPAA